MTDNTKCLDAIICNSPSSVFGTRKIDVRMAPYRSL